jgi:hypothetical protein
MSTPPILGIFVTLSCIFLFFGIIDIIDGGGRHAPALLISATVLLGSTIIADAISRRPKA